MIAGLGISSFSLALIAARAHILIKNKITFRPNKPLKNFINLCPVQINMFDQLPSPIWDFAKNQKIGHLSVRTTRGVLVHPIAYNIEKKAMVFGTPRSARKL
ncbi:MAG: hypothetical protein GWN31_11565 [Candidatus Thorarchaeota archaeon]|nr:hypothetical protein [Candidatus Thorarchaeota archaeon]NIW14542.1 hypothetical protein [Candidatus Thorarchaeota archaeon]NIW52617.1 hypothetical protein [Candidatus Korarchaeota archaeon]